MAASQNGHVEVVDKLLRNGATVDLQDEVMNTFLSLITILIGGVNVYRLPHAFYYRS